MAAPVLNNLTKERVVSSNIVDSSLEAIRAYLRNIKRDMDRMGAIAPTFVHRSVSEQSVAYPAAPAADLAEIAAFLTAWKTIANEHLAFGEAAGVHRYASGEGPIANVAGDQAACATLATEILTVWNLHHAEAIGGGGVECHFIVDTGGPIVDHGGVALADIAATCAEIKSVGEAHIGASSFAGIVEV